MTFGQQKLEIWHLDGFLYCRILTKPLPEKSGAPVWCHRGGRGSETGNGYIGKRFLGSGGVMVAATKASRLLYRSSRHAGKKVP